MKIVFMGSSTFAIPSLRILKQAQYDVKAVYSQPPRKAGRGKSYKEVPLAEFAFSEGLKVEQPPTFKDPNTIAKLKSYDPDFLVVVSYGLILPREVLEIPKEFSINVHGSFLPYWRGAAPINQAIFNRDSFTGVSIIKMIEELDAGPILKQEKVLLDYTETFGSLHQVLSELGAKNLLRVLDNIDSNKEILQNNRLVSYAPKIKKLDAKLDFNQQASSLEARVRGLAPVPGAWFEYKGERFKVFKAEVVDGRGNAGLIINEDLTIACGEKALNILEIQRQGKDIMSVSDLIRGFKFKKGDNVNQSTR
ncbi:methionyl-tRNA formyltransferase [Paracoccaceae bacterium]|nr:methionyl-tRNA formyltransferase [Paracoccaceae bacterium]